MLGHWILRRVQPAAGLYKPRRMHRTPSAPWGQMWQSHAPCFWETLVVHLPSVRLYRNHATAHYMNSWFGSLHALRVGRQEAASYPSMPGCVVVTPGMRALCPVSRAGLGSAWPVVTPLVTNKRCDREKVEGEGRRHEGKGDRVRGEGEPSPTHATPQGPKSRQRARLAPATAGWNMLAPDRARQPLASRSPAGASSVAGPTHTGCTTMLAVGRLRYHRPSSTKGTSAAPRSCIIDAQPGAGRGLASANAMTHSRDVQ